MMPTSTTLPFKICISITLFVPVALQIYLLYSLLRYREKPMLQLAQPAALTIFLVWSILATVSCCLFLFPDVNIACALYGPLLFTSISAMGSTLTARSWRVQSLLIKEFITKESRRRKPETMKIAIMAALNSISKWNLGLIRKSDVRTAGIRRKVTLGALIQVAVVLNMPQLILQVSSLAIPYLRSRSSTEYTTGFSVCKSDSYFWFFFLSIILAFLPYLATLLLNVKSTNFPDIFCEYNEVASSIGLFFMAVVIAGPTTAMGISSNAGAYLSITIVLSLTSPLCWFVIWRKIRTVQKIESAKAVRNELIKILAIEKSAACVESQTTDKKNATYSEAHVNTTTGNNKSPGEILKTAEKAIKMGALYCEIGEASKAIEAYDNALSLWKAASATTQERKNDELFTAEEIQSFRPNELDLIIRLLLAKGKTEAIMGFDSGGPERAAKSCLNAVTTFEQSSVKHEMDDPSIIFSCYSLMWTMMKGGKIQQSTLAFEIDMGQRFVSEAHAQTYHYCRALALQAEALAFTGKFHESISVINSLNMIYDPKMHTELIFQNYGIDHCAISIAQSASWHEEIGNRDQAEEVCEHVLRDIMPLIPEKNVNSMTQVLIAVIRIAKRKGHAAELRKVFESRVVENFNKYFIGTGVRTPAEPFIRPMMLLLKICDEDKPYVGMKDDIEWMLDGSEKIDSFVNSITTKQGWSMCSVLAEICLHLSKRLHDSDHNKQKLIVEGLRLSYLADKKMRNKEGNVVARPAYHVQEPIFSDLQRMAQEQNIKLKS